MLSFVLLVLSLVSFISEYLWSLSNLVSVYFVYPETCGVRLEDMDILFGDATTAMATPATTGEAGSLMGGNSPEPSMDSRRGVFEPNGSGITPSNAIPGLEIDPPPVSIKNGKPQYTVNEENGGGVGGWISRMVTRTKGDSASVENGKYRPLDQEDD